MRNEGGGFAANIWGDARRSVDRRFSSYRQPSPRGEGAPKGRIGYWRYESERGNAFQAGDVRQPPSADFSKRRCPKVVCKSLVISNPCGLTYVGANPASLGCPFQRKGREDAPLRFNQRFPRAAVRSRSGSRRSALWASTAFCFCVPTIGPFRRSCRRCDSGGNLRGQGFPCDGSGGRKR